MYPAAQISNQNENADQVRWDKENPESSQQPPKQRQQGRKPLGTLTNRQGATRIQKEELTCATKSNFSVLSDSSGVSSGSKFTQESCISLTTATSTAAIQKAITAQNQLRQEKDLLAAVPKIVRDVPKICTRKFYGEISGDSSFLSSSEPICSNDQLLTKAATVSPCGTDVSLMSLDNTNLSESSEAPIEQYTSVSISEREVHDDSIYCATEYFQDIYQYLRELEKKMTPTKPNYMDKQKDLSVAMREILIDWLVDVTAEYRLGPDTLYCAISLIDRFLSVFEVPKTKLQLIGTTAMMIAAKYEEIYPPELSEFVYITDDTYTTKQVVRMERLLLCKMNFRVSAPTSYSFATQFLKLCRASKKTIHCANYLLELSLLECSYLKYLPSHLGAAAVCLANLITGAIPWPYEIEQATEIAVTEIGGCLDDLLKSFKGAPERSCRSVYEKYRNSNFDSVAELDCPDFLPVLK